MGNLARRITAAVVNPHGTVGIDKSSSWLLDALGGGPTASGSRVSPDTMMRLTTAWRCVTLLSWLRASLPLKVLRAQEGGGAKVDRTHRNHRLLAQFPNDWQTSFGRRQYEGWSLFLHGNAYDVLEIGPDGRVVSMIPLHPERVRVFVDFDGIPVYQVTLWPSGLTQWYSRHEIYHLWTQTNNGYTGMSPIEACSEPLGLAMGLQEFASRTLAGGGLVAGVLELPPSLTPEQEAEAKSSWKDTHGTVSNAGKVAVLRNGIKFSPIGMKLSDAQTLELMGLGNEGVCQIYGVPPAMAGLPSRGSVMGNAEIARYMGFLATTLDPILIADEQAMQRDLFLPEEFEQVWPSYNRAALLNTDLLTRYRAYAIGRQWGWLTVNRILNKEDENPVGPEGDVLLDPVNMTRIPIDPTASLDAGASPSSGDGGDAQASWPGDPSTRSFLRRALMDGGNGNA